ncbi:hypothetical protein [Pandoraea sp.]|uniref:hypothetical protein n=1 Tax=Pandoraea sp. TaxID=1883445 RepID=UPI001223EFBB|nr:hypothetical protein [Pandoraea sp.]TAL53580.1 MAG: hypothetical protein EPN80_14945 [Pandoraea sp.]TAM14877.1 MAG: hypothetical protein EPN65_20095 [Pandoraea sp.]
MRADLYDFRPGRRCAMLVIAVVAAAAMPVSYGVWQDAAALSTQRAQLQAAQARLARHEKALEAARRAARQAASAGRAEAAAPLVDPLPMLAALEAAWRADISLVKLDLNAAQRRAQVQLSAQSLDALFGFVERLKQNRARVTLERHAFDERQPPEWALQASLTVNWS